MPGWTNRYYPHFANLYRYVLPFLDTTLKIRQEEILKMLTN